MKCWDGIINNATLGSAKIPLQRHDLPEYITSSIELTDPTEPEEDFLRWASIAYQYRQGGSKPFDLISLNQPAAEKEVLPYASTSATSIFNTIVSEELYPLLILWLQQCETNKVVVDPALIPELLGIAVKRKDLRKTIFSVCGKRGEWLSQFNPEWNFYTSTSEGDDIWQTGKLEERKELLRDLRIANPTRAIELLQATWNSESANEKAAFLEALRMNLTDTDVPFLEALKEKGQKVNSVIQDLLKTIPKSTVVLQYWDALKDAVMMKTGKALFGMISKTIIEVNENLAVSEAVFKTGIETLSSNKQVSDNQHILIQLISSVPPSNWNAHFNETNQAIIELFQKEKKSAIYLPAVALAAIKFKDVQWIKDLLDHSDKDLIDSSIVLLMQALPERERNKYALRFIKEKPQQIISIAIEHGEEWSIELARAILKFTADEVYTYNRTFYKPVVSLIPVKLLEELDSFTPTDDQKKTYWKTQSDELSRLLDIKKQILQSF